MHFHENANLALMLRDFNARVLWYFLAIASLSPNIVVRPIANNLKTIVKQLHRLASSLSSNYKKTYLEKRFIWQSWYKCCSRHCDSCLFFFCSCKHRLVESILCQTPKPLSVHMANATTEYATNGLLVPENPTALHSWDKL